MLDQLDPSENLISKRYSEIIYEYSYISNNNSRIVKVKFGNSFFHPQSIMTHCSVEICNTPGSCNRDCLISTLASYTTFVVVGRNGLSWAGNRLD